MSKRVTLEVTTMGCLVWLAMSLLGGAVAAAIIAMLVEAIKGDR